MPTKLIIPGLNGSGEGHWQDYWLHDDPDAVLVGQRDWSQPNFDEWLAEIEKALARHPGSILVAHSIGAVIAAGLATRASRHLVKGALLVAPCEFSKVGSLHSGIAPLPPMPSERLPFPSLLVASRNDPYMSYDVAVQYAERLGSDLVDLGRAGHVNISSGYGRWKRGYRLAARFDRHHYHDAPEPKVGFFDTIMGYGAKGSRQLD